MTIIDRGCYERGCACFDDRFDKYGVEVMTIDAMKQALEALEYIHTETTEDEDELIHAAITALRLAIEQAEKQAALDRMADNARELGLNVYVRQSLG